jgi:hypothetical protein
VLIGGFMVHTAALVTLSGADALAKTGSRFCLKFGKLLSDVRNSEWFESRPFHKKPGAKPGQAVGSRTQQGGNTTVATRHDYAAQQLWQHDGEL